jgi:hypothetical protein
MVTPNVADNDQNDCTEEEKTRGRTTEVFDDLSRDRGKPQEFSGTRVA